MPKVTISDSKGLVQATGGGLISTSTVVLKNSAGVRDSRTFRSAGTVGAARTAASATTLSVNTHYSCATGGATAMIIPSAAAGNIGDWITVLYTAVITAGATHSFTTTTDTAFALGSTILRSSGAVAPQLDVSVAADNILSIKAEAAGDGGIGTLVKFVNTTGTTNGWAVECVINHQGAGSTAKNAASVFS